MAGCQQPVINFTMPDEENLFCAPPKGTPEADFESRQPVLLTGRSPTDGSVRWAFLGKPLVSFEIPGCSQITEAEAVRISGQWFVRSSNQGFWHDRWRRQ